MTREREKIKKGKKELGNKGKRESRKKGKWEKGKKVLISRYISTQVHSKQYGLKKSEILRYLLFFSNLSSSRFQNSFYAM